MSTHFPNSQLALLNSLATPPLSDPNAEKAWHLMALLLSLGRPAPPPELASRCTLFHLTPSLLLSLCSIPNSPIALTDGGLRVTISPRGIYAVSQFVSEFNLIGMCGPPVTWRDGLRLYFRKRKGIGFASGVDGEETERAVSKRFRRNSSEKVDFPISEGIISIMNSKLFSNMFSNSLLAPELYTKATAAGLNCKLENAKRLENRKNTSEEGCGLKRITACELQTKSALLSRIFGDDIMFEQGQGDEMVDMKSRIDIDPTSCPEDVKVSSMLSAEVVHVDGYIERECYVQNEGNIRKEDEPLIDSGKQKAENHVQPIDTCLLDLPPESDCKRMWGLVSLDKEPITCNVKKQTAQKQLPKPISKLKITSGCTVASRQQGYFQSLEQSKAVNPSNDNKQLKEYHRKRSMAQNLKQKRDGMRIKEERKEAAIISPKVDTFPAILDQAEAKDLPNFESYVVEEEEGSGGYGTVYRAKRKSDGAIVAIKCPHASANRHHVSNEQRMLERFGGKNFVIKYEGCFKSGNSDCFVLEHVEHDRPEVLKKEIDIFQLRWYGYCMFRALATLHKQGIVHRDVKPGNFLFSRKSNKGYLIDFNLALDLHQKYRITNKSKVGNGVTFNDVTISNAKPVPVARNRRFLTTKSPDTVNREAIQGSKSALEPKNLKKKDVDQTKPCNNLGRILKNQGADGSGITSVKDVTSTRTPSAERRREPLPCQGRKELISLLQEAMQSPNHEASSVPTFMRKRVAAPPGRGDERFNYVTPMPLHGIAIAVTGAGLMKSKGDGKQRKEGPCVGTKGFRAPEVLFRSLHQGHKVDIWSAGVTLLYLMIGRTPFYGEPEQNIKDIVKLRGTEDLWEVSKLHDRESSFPKDLYGTHFLPSMTLREWCEKNTKRRDFLAVIPNSLIDLVDKCLTVNPRLRISAEEALMHEFFAPCHESLRKQRQLRQGHSLDSETNLPVRGQSISTPVKTSQRQR